jgi:hypothetical protein
MAIVYLHKRNDTDTVFYVGIGKTKYRAYSKSGRNKHWHNVVNKVGYSVEIIEDNILIENAFVMEKELIEKYGKISSGGSLVNITNGGEFNDYWTGKKHTEKTKKLMSKAHNGKKFSSESITKMKKPKSLQHCENISKGRIGMKFSETHIKNLSNSLKGKPAWNKGDSLSNEVKLKISNSLIGNKNAKSIKVFQYNLNGILIKEWKKLSDIKYELGYNIGNISSCISGKRKTSNGFIWKSE